MNKQLSADLAQLEQLLRITSEQGASFLQAIDKKPTTVTKKAALSGDISESGIGAAAVLAHFRQKFEPIIVASTGPRYWGFVTGGSTPAALMGDMLASFYDQNPHAVSGQGDVSAQIELETIQLLLDLFDLPRDYAGGFVTGATMSNFTCLGVARQWWGRQHGADIARNGVPGKMPIFSAVPHSSSIKSLSMLGIGSDRLCKVKVLSGNREAIDIVDLETQIRSLAGAPFIIIASAGTVNTVDYDDFKALARIKRSHNCWLHIDAAFGAFAACSPEHRHLLSGWEMADSITIDCHKWLNVPYESAFCLVKEQHKRLQVETFQNSNAPYLGNPADNFNYVNFLPENSRRLKALPVWFTLNAYGKEGYRDIVHNSIAMANALGAYIEKSEVFELLAPVRLNNVCFTLKMADQNEAVPAYLAAVNARGKVFMTPTVYNSRNGIRASFVNWRTGKADIQIAVEELEASFGEMFA